jgi:exopolysaccharide production protein ExoZ
MRIYSVQLLRAVAALLVLSGHVIGAATRAGNGPRVGLPTGAGVDLFFAISGFIMVFASDRLFTRPGASKAFFSRRIARVVPLYWLTTTAMLVVMAAGSRGISGLPDWTYILSSYLFIPDASFGSVDGIAFPLLSLGWTLNYEMFFYVVFSAFIVLPRRHATAGVVAALCAWVAFGMVIQPASTILAAWTQPIVLEFALGLLIGNALLDGRSLSRPIALAILIAACIWVVADPLGLVVTHQTPNDFRRLFGWGVPAAAVLAAVVLGPGELPASCERPAALLGDASYSLYLTHPFVLIVCERAWLGLVGPRYLAGFVILVIGLAMIASICVNKLIERPLSRAFQGCRAPIRDAAPAGT